jgi:hypothetical protein
LCHKHGMYVYPRIGPWAHGETRNGGYPDSLLQKTKTTRSDDPIDLSYVRRFCLRWPLIEVAIPSAPQFAPSVPGRCEVGQHIHPASA